MNKKSSKFTFVAVFTFENPAHVHPGNVCLQRCLVEVELVAELAREPVTFELLLFGIVILNGYALNLQRHFLQTNVTLHPLLCEELAVAVVALQIVPLVYLLVQLHIAGVAELLTAHVARHGRFPVRGVVHPQQRLGREIPAAHVALIGFRVPQLVSPHFLRRLAHLAAYLALSHARVHVLLVRRRRVGLLAAFALDAFGAGAVVGREEGAGLAAELARAVLLQDVPFKHVVLLELYKNIPSYRYLQKNFVVVYLVHSIYKSIKVTEVSSGSLLAQASRP